MIRAEFRVIYRGDSKVKQWRDAEIKDDEWKDVSVDEQRKYKQSNRCTETQDMFQDKE